MGWSSYSNRGMFLEQIIETVCRQLDSKGLALINKVPTPVKVINNNHGKVTGFYERKSTVDFEGTLKGGKSIAFDAKETRLKNLPLNNIADHQLRYLKKVRELGGYSFLIVYFRDLDVIYRLEIERITDFLKDSRNAGKKSIPIKYFEDAGLKLESRDGLALNILQNYY